MTHQYSPSEELANAITHGIGALLSVVGLTLLVFYAKLQNDILRMSSFAIYGSSLVLLFLASTLYHAVNAPKTKRLLKLFDHCAIYLLIAGTYTPLMLLLLENTLGVTMLIIVWLLAIVGISFKVIFGHQYKFISILSYLGLGFISLACIEQLSQALHSSGLFLLCLGGGFYTVGVIFYINKRIPYNHAIWHLFVLAGAISHFLLMWYYV